MTQESVSTAIGDARSLAGAGAYGSAKVGPVDQVSARRIMIGGEKLK
jgi:hypothetical protein